jgi:L-amino acid N-acyltransferase YncA
MIKFRKGTYKDIDRLTEIYNWAIVNTTATFDLSVQSVEKRLKWFEQFGDYYPLIIADIEGEAVGYACLTKFRDKEAYSKTVEVSIYIHPDYHNKGIGKCLLTEIIKKGKKRGFKTIIAGITAGNFVSIKMHEDQGFTPSGYFKAVGFKFDKWLDVWFYQLTF